MQPTLTKQTLNIQHRTELYGSFAARFVSFLVDSTLLVFLYSFLLYFTTKDHGQLTTWKELLQEDSVTLDEGVQACKTLFYNLYFPVLHWLYYTLLESSKRQATIGKFTLGLRVTDLRGKRINFLQANLRYFSKVISCLPVFLGFLVMLSTRRRQMLHDYIARTLVLTD
ncbi:RDD family protein [Pontibacter silvestris]|uniref:RDD family protein n=1 Tax=Pontibacter silvestris TaxID=2305183 RepID=A0ABW4WUF9_9BACT|nr:RDD family protein [Pontibacter silvestris]MCC9136157.1 RDD family protein [Pontibacter silvestris]